MQKVWLETFTKAMQAAFKFTPDSAPPEIVRQIRTGIFQTLAQSWDEFLRSPQFLDGMRQWMENAIAFRQMTNEFMGRVRNEIQAPSRSDIDTIMLTVRHMEKRLLDRLEELSAKVEPVNKSNGRARMPGSARVRVGAKGKKSTRRKPHRATSEKGGPNE